MEKLSRQQRKRLTLPASVSFVPRLSASTGLDWNWVFLRARVAYNKLQEIHQRAHAVYRGPSQFRFFFFFAPLLSSLHFGNDPSRYRLRGQSIETFFSFFGTVAEVVRARPDFWKEVNSGLIKGGP